jgi:hypothetical protein
VWLHKLRCVFVERTIRRARCARHLLRQGEKEPLVCGSLSLLLLLWRRLLRSRGDRPVLESGPL